MAETTYSFEISTSFPNGKVDGGSLHEEISGSVIVTAIGGVNTYNGECIITFKAALSVEDEAALTIVLSEHTGDPESIPMASLDLHGNTKTTNQIGIGGGFREISHNFCDKTTWWHGSLEVLNDSSTTSDMMIYNLSRSGIIDVRHSKITFEDDLTETTVTPDGIVMSNIVPTVKVNGVALDQSNEDAIVGDDRYIIDYSTGMITFFLVRTILDVVTADFRVSDSSIYVLAPVDGERIVLEDAEIDLSEDINLTSAFITTVYGSHSVMTGGTMVPVQVKKYKTFHDFQSAARRFRGPIPVGFGGVGGILSPKWTFEWQYSRSDELYDTLNYVDLNLDASKTTRNRLEISIDGDAELGGSLITITFYGQKSSESE